MDKDALRDEINYIVQSSYKVSNYSEAYMKLYKAYNEYSNKEVELTSSPKIILQKIYDEDGIEELYFIARKIFLKDLKKPYELEVKLKSRELNLNTDKVSPVQDFGELFRPTSYEEAIKMFED